MDKTNLNEKFSVIKENWQPVYLASTSPRRSAILKQMGVPYQVVSIEVDETLLPAENATDYVIRVAQLKAAAGLCHPKRIENYPVVSADTTVVIRGQILCKPKDKPEFMRFFQLLSGNIHTVYTAVCVAGDDWQRTVLVNTDVKFATLTEPEMEWYWHHYQPTDKAAGYGIQDFAEVFIEWIKGSYSNVMGLPARETYLLLQQYHNDNCSK